MLFRIPNEWIMKMPTTLHKHKLIKNTPVGTSFHILSVGICRRSTRFELNIGNFDKLPRLLNEHLERKCQDLPNSTNPHLFPTRKMSPPVINYKGLRSPHTITQPSQRFRSVDPGKRLRVNALTVSQDSGHPPRWFDRGRRSRGPSKTETEWM